MKVLKFSLFLSLLLISQLELTEGRGNPIMVIEFGGDCDTYDIPGLQRETLNTRELKNYIVNCDDNVELCRPGYVKDTLGTDMCECIPDCTSLFPDCPECDEDPEWLYNTDSYGDLVGICSCLTSNQMTSFCGCPPWLTQLPHDATLNYAPCTVPEAVPCYNGGLTIISKSVNCQQPNQDGLIQATVEIAVETMGACVSIVSLENCELSAGEDFVIALASQYQASAAFCALQNETTILLDFFFDLEDPELPSWVYKNSNGEEVTQNLLEPEDLCLAPIPTLSTWMIIALGLIMAISGLVFVKRKEVRAFIAMF